MPRIIQNNDKNSASYFQHLHVLYSLFALCRGIPVAYFTQKVRQSLDKPPMKFNGGLANLELTFLEK